MEILRTQKMETTNIQIGDTVTVDLNGFGTYDATVQLVTDDDILFMFDDCITEHKMNNGPSNQGGFEFSDLNWWMQNTLRPTFPEELKNKIIMLSIPTYGMMFGHDVWYDDFVEPDNDEQLPLMKKRKNRIADYDNEYSWYWVQNKIVNSPSYFAFVGSNGLANYNYASNVYGVRPVFLVKR